MSAYGSSLRLFEDLDALLLESHRVLIPDVVREELLRLSRGGGRAGLAAKLALDLSRDLQTVHVEARDGDEAILRLADLYGGRLVACTNDSELKNILKAKGARVIGVRDFSHLDFL